MATFARARLVPLLPVRDMSRALRFYTKKLGAKVLMRAPGPMRNYWASIRIGQVEVWFVRPDQPEKRNLSYHTFLVRNVRSAVKGLQKKGVRFDRGQKTPATTKLEGPINWEPWGGSAYFRDTEGNLLMVWQNIPPM